MSGKGGKDGKGGMEMESRAQVARHWRRILGRVLVILPALPAFPALPALSQTDPRLIGVIRHAQEGQGDSARAEVQRLLASTSPGDTLYPQIIYTQAMVASDAADMRRQLQRVAVEYPSSSWADDALLRLVQLDYASGNLNGAARNLERIRLDYPGSALLPQAAYWAARTYFDQKNPEAACRWISDGLAGSQGNIELQNQLGYLNQRCSLRASAGVRPPRDSQSTLPSVGPDTTRPSVARADTTRPSVARADTIRRPKPATPAPPPTRLDSAKADTTAPARQAARPGGRFRIQITAVRTAAAAEAIAAKLKRKGLAPVTVQEGGLYKVRVGEYATKAEAVAAVPEIKAKLGGSPFVVAGS